MQVTTNERVHDDSKALSGLVDNFVKSNKIIDKLFADDGPMIVMIFSNA